MNECQKNDMIPAEFIAFPSKYPNIFGIYDEELKQIEEQEAEEEE